jgi:hypothetical protein
MADAQELQAEAENCRRLAQEADSLTMRLLLELAEQYEAEARLQLLYSAATANRSTVRLV